jgi:antitoxin FitA
MGVLTIRNLDDSVKQELRTRAATHRTSVEGEVRALIEVALRKPARKKSIYEQLTKLGIKPTEPFDQKKITDEMWDESLR